MPETKVDKERFMVLPELLRVAFDTRAGASSGEACRRVGVD
ncbi:MAG: hypothetical protein QXH34_07825 [Ignisphaera sp.]